MFSVLNENLDREIGYQWRSMQDQRRRTKKASSDWMAMLERELARKYEFTLRTLLELRRQSR